MTIYEMYIYASVSRSLSLPSRSEGRTNVTPMETLSGDIPTDREEELFDKSSVRQPR